MDAGVGGYGATGGGGHRAGAGPGLVRRFGGLFHPALGRLRTRWREAERAGQPPSRFECRRLLAESGGLPFRVHEVRGGQRVERVGDCSVLDLDAVAKGWIVDRAAEAGLEPGVDWVMVNVGGDLRLAGPGSVRVAIENPTAAIDNAPPLGVVVMQPGGLASSGSARRGFTVGGRRFGHVLDPRTGWPVEDPVGVTVIASDTATADALATVLGIAGLDQPASAALLARVGAAALVVNAEGNVGLSPRWPRDVDSDLAATD